MQEDSGEYKKDGIPYIEISDVRTPAVKKSEISRRNFFRAGLVVATSVVLPIVGFRYFATRKKASQKIVVTSNCVGCTGCVIMCPVLAIGVVEGGITVNQEKCISCGYCQAGCATDGIRVLQENINHA